MKEAGAQNSRELLQNVVILPSSEARDLHEFKQMITSFSEDRVQLVVVDNFGCLLAPTLIGATKYDRVYLLMQAFVALRAAAKRLGAAIITTSFSGDLSIGKQMVPLVWAHQPTIRIQFEKILGGNLRLNANKVRVQVVKCPRAPCHNHPHVELALPKSRESSGGSGIGNFNYNFPAATA